MDAGVPSVLLDALRDAASACHFGWLCEAVRDLMLHRRHSHP